MMHRSFDRLSVIRFDDGEWPDRRVSLRADYEHHAVMISPRFTHLDMAQEDAEYIAMAVNYHDRLVEALRSSLEWMDALASDDDRLDVPGYSRDRIEILLAELSAHNGGEE